MLQRLTKTLVRFMAIILYVNQLFEGFLQDLKLESLAWKMADTVEDLQNCFDGKNLRKFKYND